MVYKPGLQDSEQLHCWHIRDLTGKQNYISILINLRFVIFKLGKKDNIQRSFKYSLSRQDIEQAVFAP